jgi:hypothetical protein
VHDAFDNLLVSVMLLEQGDEVINVIDDNFRIFFTSFAEGPLRFLFNFMIVQVLRD